MPGIHSNTLDTFRFWIRPTQDLVAIDVATRAEPHNTTVPGDPECTHVVGVEKGHVLDGCLDGAQDAISEKKVENNIVLV